MAKDGHSSVANTKAEKTFKYYLPLKIYSSRENKKMQPLFASSSFASHAQWTEFCYWLYLSGKYIYFLRG